MDKRISEEELHALMSDDENEDIIYADDVVDHITAVEEMVRPEIITTSGIYVNQVEKQWEIWFVPTPEEAANMTDEEAMPEMLGFCSFEMGFREKEIWKMEFFHRWSGMRTDIDGWMC